MDLAHRILVPVDFSDCSRRALAYAVALAERVGAAVDLLYVRELNLAWAWAPFDVVAFDSNHGLLADAIGASHALAEWVEETSQRTHVPVRGVVERGDPLHTILEVAAHNRYDFIVMGTHGHSGMSLPLLGNITRRVMKRAPCPVITLRSPPPPPARRAHARLAP